MSWGAVIGAVGSIGGALLSNSGSGDAADDITDAQRMAMALSQKAIGESVADVTARGDIALDDIEQGFTQGIDELGKTGPALEMEQALTGVLGKEAQQEAIDSFIASPGQEFLRDKQEGALLRNEAAIGGLGGGNVRTALQEQAFGRAATTLQQAIENARSLRSGEQATQTNKANLFSQGGVATGTQQTNIGNALANIRQGGATQQIPLLQNIGSANAAATLGQSTAQQQGLSSIAELLSQFLTTSKE